MKIRLGIIGLGTIFAKKHLPVLLSSGERFDVRYIYSSSQEKFTKARLRFPAVQHCQTVAELLSKPEVDALVACVPINLHGPIAAKVLKARKHLLLEKPLAPGAAVANNILSLAKRNKCRVMVAENFRYLKSFERVKEIIAQKTLGRLLFVQVHALKKFDRNNPYYRTGWRVNPKGYPGIMLDGGIHVVSMLRDLFPKLKPRYRYRRSFDKALGTFDTALLHVEFARNLSGVLFMSYALQNSDGYFLKLYFERGTVQANMFSVVIEQGEARRVEDCPSQDYRMIYDDFYQLVTGNKKPRYDLTAAYEDLRLYERLFK